MRADIASVWKRVASKKTLVVFFIFALITFLYFYVPISVFPDSVDYYNYMKIFTGLDPIYSWNLIRGPSFPVLIYLFVTFFGGAMVGLLVGSYLFFAGLITVIYVTLKKVIDDLRFNKPKRIFVLVMFLGLIVFNPILFGYSHALLTEFVAAFFAFVSCIISWKWLNVDFSTKKIKYVLYSIFFATMFIFIWFLKQPYFTIASFPLLIASTISIIECCKLRNILQRLGTVIFCFACLFIAISGWRAFLINNWANPDLVSGKDDYFLSGSIIKGISNARLVTSEEINIDEVNDDKLISSEDKNKIAQIINEQSVGGHRRVQVLDVFSRSGNLVDKIVIYQESETFTTKDAINTWVTVATTHPFLLIDSYMAGYLATIDLYDFATDPKTGTMTPVKTAGLYGHENYTIGLLYVASSANMADSTRSIMTYPGLQQIFYNPESTVRRGVRLYGMVHSEVFMASFLILPAVLVYTICMYIRLRKKKVATELDKAARRVYGLIVIILSFTFLHIVSNVVLGAIIDRYIYVTFPGVAFSYILLICMNTKLGALLDGVCLGVVHIISKIKGKIFNKT